MKKISKIIKKHPCLSTICFLLSILCLVHLFPTEHDFITSFKFNWDNYISYLYSVMLTTAIALIVYLFVDTETTDKLNKIETIESNIKTNTDRISEITTMVQNDVNKMEENVQKISEIQEIQNKVAFEIEKKRLMNSPVISFPSLSEENISVFKNNINMIFYENKCDLSIIENETEPICSFTFIKEGNKPYTLPKIFYLFDKKHDTPHFCVRALEGNKTAGIQQDEYYYLSYDFDLSDKQIVWYLGKKAPMFKDSSNKKFKVSLSSMSGDGGIIPSANDFCKDC